MNVETRHIMTQDELEKQTAAIREQYQRVPRRFQREAERAMASGGYAAPGTALAAWAEKRRTKERRRRKLAKQSRRRNRAR